MHEEFDILQQIAIWTLPILFAITAHEAAHAWAACQLGDKTAQRLGRITLNPFKHIDLIGTVILPLALLLMNTGFVIGWAKPVPVNWNNLYKPRRDMALVALAGPGANLLMAIGWVIIIKIGFLVGNLYTPAFFLVYVGQAGILINCVLLVLNLLPILPLDGGRVLHGIMPIQWAKSFGELEPYGLFILIGLLASGVLDAILLPIVRFLYAQLLYIN